MKTNDLKIYFSLRSPYSFLGLYRFKSLLPQLELDYELIAIYPPKEITDKPIATKPKLKYILQDIKRTFHAYDLPFKMPDPFDIKWVIPHAAFIYADQQGKGLEFACQSYAARFCRGEDISRQEILVQLAELCGLDSKEILEASKSRKYQRELLLNARKVSDDDVFGVPSFVYENEMFWGNDRLEWLVRMFFEKKGEPVPDLSADPMHRPF